MGNKTMFNIKNGSKAMLAICVTVGTFYCATAFAYSALHVDAGQDIYFNSANSGSNIIATLQGVVTDPNSGTLTYYWTCNGGTLSDATILTPNFTALYTSQKVSYTCTLKATDSYGVTNTDDVPIYVNYNIGVTNPGAQTNAATNISANTAVFNGTFYPKTSSAYGTNYSVWFQWGTTTSYGAETNQQAVVSLLAYYFSQNVAGLTPNTQYHYRAMAQDKTTGQLYYGPDVSFYTTGGSGIILASSTSGSPSNVFTGVTNDLLKDSFFLPLLVLVMGSWMFIFLRKKA